MSDSSKAIFLSYAREDAGAARRIAEALRAAGHEVWFDENELRGGDAWDAKIRKQIDACALFIPLISAHTQERSKGYFRLEWKLAVDQTHLLAAGVPFIAPVAIDDTKEDGALVPPEFLKVQWTRLPGALPTPEFVAQVKRLLGSPAPAASATPAAATSAASVPVARKSSLPLALLVGFASIAVSAGLVLVVMRRGEPTAKSTEPAKAAPVAEKPAAKPARLADKSVAVLPFTNMSEDKDSGYFADGVHEDVLTNLALIRELRVVSRTSVMQYRGTSKTMKQLGEELGVTYVLEGSVRRVGNKVRVTGQLIHAASDEHVWAQTYDRDLTDIFAIQSEISQQIAKALSAALSPQEKTRLEHVTSVNPEAYDLLLRARQIDRIGNDTRQELLTQEAMLQKAVTLDPAYASAWAALSWVHSQIIFNGVDASDARMAKAREAMETARRIDGENPDVQQAIGTYYYYALRDYPKALEYFERYARQYPNNYLGYFLTGLVQRRQGRWAESLANLKRASELDPGSPEHARNLMISYAGMRRYADAVREQERRVRLMPESLRESFEVARLKFFLDGSTAEGDALLAGPIANRADPAVAAGYRKLWASMKGDLATVIQLNRSYPEAWAPGIASGGGSPSEYALQNAIVLAAMGDRDGARRLLEKHPAELRARLVNEPENVLPMMILAQIEALLGNAPEALAVARRSCEILPLARDPLSGRGPRLAYAFVLAWTGDKAGACAELRRLFATNGQLSARLIKTSPLFAPLKGDPEFEAIVNDPKNLAPLF